MAQKIKAIGCDVVNIFRIKKIIDKYNKKVLSYLFSSYEYEVCKLQKFPELWFSICFAGKESVSKALGTGIGKICFNNIEIIPNNFGKAKINLTGIAVKCANKKNISFFYLKWFFFEKHIFVTIDAY